MEEQLFQNPDGALHPCSVTIHQLIGAVVAVNISNGSMQWGDKAPPCRNGQETFMRWHSPVVVYVPWACLYPDAELTVG